MVYALAFVGGLLGPSAAGEAFGTDGQIVNDVIELAGSLLVVCIGIAVLKYRLYAIDRIISRVVIPARSRLSVARRSAAPAPARARQ